MKLYRITHTTAYTYSSEVTGSYGLFHLRPRNLPWQVLRDHRVEVSPEPEELSRHGDVFENTKSWFHVTEPHRKLIITATSDVDVSEPVHDQNALARPWEECRPAQRTDLRDAWRAVEFTLESPRVDLTRQVEAYANASFTPGRPIGEVAWDLMHRIYTDFEYKSGTTTVTTRVNEVLRQRRGVCQDFAQLLVACLRTRGLAGRYVSGYLATIPPPGQERLVGADASHAWAGVWVPGMGWYDLDPTNDKASGTSHATVAIGRDYGDVAPVKGVIFTRGRKSRMKVIVDMAPR